MELIAPAVFVFCALALVLILDRNEAEEKAEQEFLAKLPTLETARTTIQQTYPNHVDEFKLVKKSVGCIHGMWGTTVHFYGDFLECKSLGVIIRVQPTQPVKKSVAK